MEYSQIQMLSPDRVFLNSVIISALDHGIIYLPHGMETQAVEASKTFVSGWHTFSWYHNPTSASFHQAIGSLQPPLPTPMRSSITPAGSRLRQQASRESHLPDPVSSFLSFPNSPPHPLPLAVQEHCNFNTLGENAAWGACTSTSALHPVGPCPVIPGTQPCFQVLEHFHWDKREF